MALFFLLLSLQSNYERFRAIPPKKIRPLLFSKLGRNRTKTGRIWTKCLKNNKNTFLILNRKLEKLKLATFWSSFENKSGRIFKIKLKEKEAVKPLRMFSVIHLNTELYKI